MFFKIEEYKYTIKVVSGLYIGGGDSAVRIGGVDNEFIKHPINKLPFIPGSSVKGKIRSLLEYDAGILPIRMEQSENNKNPKGSPLCVEDLNSKMGDKNKIRNIIMLFGSSSTELSSEIVIPITRVSFTDLELEASDNNMDTSSIFEVKAETGIDRTTGTANGGSLRFTERVGAGVTFKGSVILKKFKGDDEKQLLDTLIRGFYLLHHDTLGGSGSRGYGKVEIKFENSHIQEYLDNYKYNDGTN